MRGSTSGLVSRVQHEMSKATRSWIPAQSIFLILGFATLTVISAEAGKSLFRISLRSSRNTIDEATVITVPAEADASHTDDMSCLHPQET